jgi:sporulation protein YlmC with PRC-barrel domain
MLRSLKELERYKVTATDGDIGHVVNFLLDDEHWVIRHLVVDTGGFLDGRRVLISPISFQEVDWANKRFHLALTIDTIKSCPRVNWDKPVTRQHELDYYGHHRYPHYWGSSWMWGTGNTPGLLANSQRNESQEDVPGNSGDIHLRGANEVCGYFIQGSDEAIGHVEDFIVDDETWAIRYLVINTSNWLFGKNVLVAPHWATSVSWEERNVYVALSRQEIKDSPVWNPTDVIDRGFEARLHMHYGLPAYWADRERRPRVQPPHHVGNPPG